MNELPLVPRYCTYPEGTLLIEWSQGSARSETDSIDPGARVTDRPHTTAKRPYTRRGGGHGRMALFTMPLRRPVPDGAYTDRAPVCWWSLPRWVDHVMTLYDTFYKDLRASGQIPSISRRTLELIVRRRAEDADYDTGRNCRTPVGDVKADGTRTGLCAVTERSRRQVQRGNAVLRYFQVMTEVQPGRLRTKAERLESYKRGDRNRGWTAVHALHETTNPELAADLPVDNSTLDTQHRHKNVTPPRSGSVGTTPSCRSVVSTAKNVKKRRAPRGSSTKAGRKSAAAFDPRALLLAQRCRTHPDMPGWVRRHGAKAWAAVLTRPAQHGWTADDVVAAIDDFALTRQVLPRPRNAIGYLAMILTSINLEAPPAALERARRAEEDALLREQQRRRRAEHAEQLRAAASPESPGRKAALSIARHAARRSSMS